MFGIAACAPLPVATISKMSNAPISGPTRVAIVPSGIQRPVVHSVHGAHRKSLEEAFFDHHPAAALVLLGRLENEIDGAVEVALPRERRGRAQQHRRVAVMAARVHLALDFRRVRDAGFLVDVQRIEVGAQADRAGAGSAA